MSKHLQLLYLTFLSLLLSSCAHWYDKQVDIPANYHRPQQIDRDFAINGRFAIKSGSDNYYGNFSWQHALDKDKLDMYTPFGVTVAQIKIESGISQLITDNKTYTGADNDKILEEHLGFTLPLAYLHYWIQGVPLPSAPLEGRLASGFNQLQWSVEYLSWQDTNHPQIVQLSHENLRIKLLINWAESINYANSY